MGYATEINSCLKIPLDETKLKVGQRYNFEKKGERIYSLRIPMDLINDKWEVIGKVIIREVTIGEGKTKGTYEVLKIYDEQERKIFTDNVIPFDRIK